jgi:hypothetical protein
VGTSLTPKVADVLLGHFLAEERVHLVLLPL